MKAIYSLLLVWLISAGCASTTSTSSNSKAPPKEIAVFQAEQKPDREFTVLGTLKDDAAEAEEDEVFDQFKKRAAKMGGDAIIIHPKKDSGMEIQPFGFGKINKTFLYTVDVIRFR